MKARRLIQSSAFNPETLRVISQAFDDAWSEIAHCYNGDPRIIEQARLRLAHSVLVVADEGSNDPKRVKQDALRIMTVAHTGHA